MIEIDGLRKSYGDHAAVRGVTLRVAEGENVVLLGPSGCGKTTTLRMINRLVEPTGGRVRIAGRDTALEDPVRLRRRIGYMIQGIGLFPHRNVEDNILTVPRLLGWTRAACRRRAGELMELVNLPAALATRFPHELSGGQRQRVGLARALAADPPILLMDEPFGALDPVTRAQIRAEFRRLGSLIRKTIVLVTHDVAEAVELGDRVCLMNDGRVEQVGPPARLLFRPRTDFVRAFLDPGRLLTELSAVRLHELALPVDAAAPLQVLGLPASLTVAEAFPRLENDDAALSILLGAFTRHKRGRARGWASEPEAT